MKGLKKIIARISPLRQHDYSKPKYLFKSILFGDVMRVLITGATGYVGHGVAKAFRAKGHTVYGLVRSEEDAHLLSLEKFGQSWAI